MFNTQLSPRGPVNVNRPAPTRQNPGIVYGQRGTDFQRLTGRTMPVFIKGGTK